MNVDQQLTVIERGMVALTERNELREKLARGTPLRVKLGVDPTAADLHLGFTVVLRKLRQFQDLGHQAVLIIGSYTAQVGDPSGRDKTRPQLTEAQVLANAEQYLTQACRILDRARLEVRYNGEWFSRMGFMDVIRLLAKTTVARTLEREDFAQRMQAGTAIHLHELIYPLMQGYDSVMINADVELGGNDQTFNLMVGRDLQRDAGQAAQVCLTMPLLEGLDGVRKMSKSYGNYVGIADPPHDMFGKLMSLGDALMWKYFELLTDVPLEQVHAWQAGVKAGTQHPMEIKKTLAGTIVAQYHGAAAATAARAEFERVFSQHALPEEMPDYTLSEAGAELDLVKVMLAAKLAPSASEARRLIQQGAVSIDETKVSALRVPLPAAASFVLRAGKRRFLRVTRAFDI
jgi:tyrosyl-tRNA synthetase